MDWIVSVNYNDDTRTIFRTCPKCKDIRIIRASQIYDGYCPNCGQKMEKDLKEINNGWNATGRLPD